ncbi:MAG: hypothetical protein ACP5QR_16830, partial [Rhizomicrobium sp.]
ASVARMSTKTVRALQTRLKTQSLRSLAREIPCSPSYLCDVLHGRRDPGPRILDFLGAAERAPKK